MQRTAKVGVFRFDVTACDVFLASANRADSLFVTKANGLLK